MNMSEHLIKYKVASCIEDQMETKNTLNLKNETCLEIENYIAII